MKPGDIDTVNGDVGNEENNESQVETEETPAVVGDVIGSTAYSQRFVLKILLKFANVDTLREEMTTEAFEYDLCTLWDMTAERDVVLFLQEHGIWDLFQFAFPIIDIPGSTRVMEIILGIISNMTCHKEAVDSLLSKREFLNSILLHVTSDDSAIVVQILRLVNAGLYQENDTDVWMDIFKTLDYPKPLFYIMKNSLNKEVLCLAIENFNAICFHCNKEPSQEDFYTYFVVPEAVDALNMAFDEVINNMRCQLGPQEMDRIFLISLQICLNLIGFDRSPQIFHENKNDFSRMINNVLVYYEIAVCESNMAPAGLIDLVDCANSIADILELGEVNDLNCFFTPSFNMWKKLKVVTGSVIFGPVNEQLLEFGKKMIVLLCNNICIYMEQCSMSNLNQVLDAIGIYHDEIVNATDIEKLKKNVLNRTSVHRSRVRDGVDS